MRSLIDSDNGCLVISTSRCSCKTRMLYKVYYIINIPTCSTSFLSLATCSAFLGAMLDNTARLQELSTLDKVEGKGVLSYTREDTVHYDL